MECSAPSAQSFIQALQHAGAPLLEALVDIAGPMAHDLAQALLWEGLGANGHVNPGTGVTAKNGEPLLVLKGRFMLAAFMKALTATTDVNAKEAAAATAAADKDPEADAGPNIQALVQAAGYGDWPRVLWPTKAMLNVLTRAPKGEKGSPVPWADPKTAPRYDPLWSKGD